MIDEPARSTSAAGRGLAQNTTSPGSVRRAAPYLDASVSGSILRDPSGEASRSSGGPITRVPDQDAMSLGKQIALAMGLPDNAVRVAPFDTTLTDARVVLGADWTQLGQVPVDQAPTPSDAASAGGDGSSTSSATPADGSKSGTGKATTSHRSTATSGHSSR